MVEEVVGFCWSELRIDGNGDLGGREGFGVAGCHYVEGV